MDDPTPDDVVMIEIIIRRVINADGRLAMMVKLPTQFSSIEVFGLLEAAKVYSRQERRSHDRAAMAIQSGMRRP